MWHKIYSGLSAALIGSSAIVMVQPQVAVSQTLDEQAIASVAKEVTVIINGQNPGSGVLIAKQGNTYYVLTAKHVVPTPDEYEIITFDGTKHTLDYGTVKKLPDVDLAVVQFTSNQSYRVAQLGNSDTAAEGATIYISGWPHPGEAITQRIFQITSGKISGRSQSSLEDGYALVYTNTTSSGMSGGPLFDQQGQVIGIHGRAEGQNIVNADTGQLVPVKSGFNLGIPIKTFFDLTSPEDLPQNPMFTLPLSAWGEEFLKEKQWTEAIAQYERSLAADARDVKALFGMGLAKYELGQTEEAIRHWQVAVEVDGKKILPRLAFGTALYGAGKRQQGLAMMSAALQSYDEYKNKGNLNLEALTQDFWGQRLQTEARQLLAYFKPSKLIEIYHFARISVISPDLKTITRMTSNSLSQWNLDTGKFTRTITDNTHYWSLALSPNGQLLAAGTVHGTIDLWNLSNGQLIRTLNGHANDNGIGFVRSVAFGLDGNTLATAGDDDTIKVWDVSTGNLIHTFRHRILSPPSVYYVRMFVAFSPDSKTLASGSSDQTIKLWDADTGQEIRTFRHNSQVSSIAFSPDGKTLASGEQDGTIKLWNIASGQELRTLKEDYEVEILAFSPDGQILVSQNRYNIKLWVLSASEDIPPLILFNHPPDKASAVVFSPNGQYFVSSSPNTIALWQLPKF